eukprot:g45644.t1
MKQSKIADKNTSFPAALNAFYVWFEQTAAGMVSSAPTAPDAPVPCVIAADIRSVLLRVNPRKMTGLDGVPGRALRSCADQLAELFTLVLWCNNNNLPLNFGKTKELIK